MNIFKKALIVALSVGLISVPTVTKEVEVVEAATNEVELLLKPNSNWTKDKARFALYTWNDSGNKWISMNDSNGDGFYEVLLPSGYTSVIFCRMNPNTSSNNWNNKWNQTGNLTFNGTSNLFTVPSGAWDGSTSGWSVKNLYNLTYNYNDGVTKNKSVSCLSKGISRSIILDSAPERENYTFKGWSIDNNDTYEYVAGEKVSFTYTGEEITLYGVWEENKSTDCNVIYVVDGNEFKVTGTIGTSVEDNVPTKLIESLNYRVVEWDKAGEITEGAIINAVSYYTTIEETKAQLGFDYTFEASTRIWLQCPQAEGSKLPEIWAQVGDDSVNGNNFEMIYDDTFAKDSNGKLQFFADVPLKYNKIQFKFTTSEGFITFPNDSLTDRDYINNASWFNSSTENKLHQWQMESDDFKGITNVSNLAARFSTGDSLNHSKFKGVTSYGIDVTVDDKTLSSESEYVSGEGKFEWDTVLYNIDSENFNTDISFVAWVKIGGKKYNLSNVRTETIVSLATIYTKKDINYVEKLACQYIVDNYAVAE